MSTSVTIHQIFYRPEQQALLDPDGVPFDNCNNPNPDWCEYHIFREAYQQQVHLNADYTGYVSWKFKQKTGLSLQQFKAFIDANPGYDAYAINPFPLEALRYKNIWQHGEQCHKNLIKLTQAAAQQTHHSLDCFDVVMPHTDMLFCNYWVGNARFWDTYMAFAEPLYLYFTEEATHDVQKQLRQKATSYNNTVYAPYLIERLLSSLVYQSVYQSQHTPNSAANNLNVCLYSWSAKEVAERHTHSSEEDIQRLFSLRKDYENVPTAYKENILYTLVKLINADTKSCTPLISWAEAAFRNPNAPTSKQHIRTKLNLHLRLLTRNKAGQKAYPNV